MLTDTISELHARSRATYGKRRIRAALAIEHGLIVNPKLITKIMRDLAITGLPALKKGRRNMVSVATYEDLVNREFRATTANALWLTDIERHEALLNREGVQDPLRQRVAAGW